MQPFRGEIVSQYLYRPVFLPDQPTVDFALLVRHTVNSGAFVEADFGTLESSIPIYAVAFGLPLNKDFQYIFLCVLEPWHRSNNYCRIYES